MASWDFPWISHDDPKKRFIRPQQTINDGRFRVAKPKARPLRGGSFFPPGLCTYRQFAGNRSTVFLFFHASPRPQGRGHRIFLNVDQGGE